jgi:hypothetical protein
VPSISGRGRASYALGKRRDCGGRKHNLVHCKAATIHYSAKRGGKGVVVLAVKDHRGSLRDIARELQAMGYTNKRGAPLGGLRTCNDFQVPVILITFNGCHP